jgi:hypothetical protein
MRKQDIEITISPTGEVSFTIKGVKGAACLDETRFLEEALGGDVVERERTSEYYEAPDGGYATSHAGGGEGSDED